MADYAYKSYHSYGRKYNPDLIYDDSVMRLFRNLLHQADENQIVFARRGKSARQSALENAIKKAQANFRKKYQRDDCKPTQVFSGFPHEFAGLQVIDYYLWALQRFLERGEDRFFLLLEKDFRLILDLDDRRIKSYGVYYTEKNPLRIEKIKPVAG